ncbi:MAG: TonB-dependent receptor [Bacteroidetes bacterium]|jgi:iron complex outermembrane receptor protein|nr:TonB-dependent receptor [Bacteroidota bacterium]
MILHFEAAFNRQTRTGIPGGIMRALKRPFRTNLLLAIVGPAAVTIAQELVDTTRTYRVDAVTVVDTRAGMDPARLPYSSTVLPIGSGATARNDALAGALEYVPGVFASSRSGSTDLRLTIRGFGARGNGDRSNSGTIRGVKVLLDGIPLTEPDGRTSPDLLTFLQSGRVEVIRTNASVLFGNASGGIVNIESAEPGETTAWSLSGSGGSYGMRKIMGRVGLPFAGGSLSVSGGHLALEGWRQNSGVSASSLYAVAVARPTTDLRVRATMGLTRHRFGIPGALTDAEYSADPSLADPVYARRRERRDNLVGLSSIQVSQTIDGRHTVSASAYLGPKSLTRSERNTYREFQRWAGGGGAVWRWLLGPAWAFAAGFDAAAQDGGSQFYSLVNGERGDSLRTNKAERVMSSGVFVEGSAALTDAWSVSAGLRYDRQRYRSSVFPAGVTLTPRFEELTFEHATPHVGVSWRLDERHMTFASVSGGLEVPAFNEVDPPPGIGATDLNPLLKPMISTTVEAGHRFHAIVSDGWTVSASAAVFHIEVRNEIVPFNNGAWFLSAGRSERDGAELSAAVRASWGAEAILSATILKGRYREFISTAGTYTGNVVPGIPSHLLSARIQYPVGEGLAVELSGRQVGSMKVDDANTLAIPTSSVVDAAVTWSRDLFGTRVTVRCDARNLLDVTYTAGAFINPTSRPVLASLGGSVAPAYREPGLPRNFVLTVSVGS